MPRGNMPQFKAALIDRDGTLNREVEYLHRIDDFVWIPGAAEAIRRLNDSDVLVFVVTNQAGVAWGYYSEKDVQALHDYMQRELAKTNAHIDAFYYCPYHPEGTVDEYRRHSSFRKPDTGMFEKAMNEWKIRPRDCVVIGDKEIDMRPGHALGMTTILVETGYGLLHKSSTTADHVTADIFSATDIILGSHSP